MRKKYLIFTANFDPLLWNWKFNNGNIHREGVHKNEKPVGIGCKILW
jgi:hypothetical protein